MSNEEFVESLKQFIKTERKGYGLSSCKGYNCEIGVSVFPFDAYNEYLFSIYDYIHLSGLYKYLMAHMGTGSKVIEDLIKHNKEEFEFLNNFIEEVPQGIHDLKYYGPMDMARIYIKKSRQKENQNIR